GYAPRKPPVTLACSQIDDVNEMFSIIGAEVIDFLPKRGALSPNTSIFKAIYTRHVHKSALFLSGILSSGKLMICRA
ncbi:MAG: hypothetical protein ACRC2U_13505, partial [Aeromonas sp.]